jgi:Pregnancy-associated plasma protein-A
MKNILFAIRKTRLLSPLLIGHLMLSCTDGALPPIHYSLPENVRYLKLKPTVFTNSKTIVANGINQIQFQIVTLDKDKKELFFVSTNELAVLINDQTELKEPFIFSTDQPGEYRFSIKNVNSSDQLGRPIVTAMAPPELKEVVFPVIFHVVSSAKDSAWIRGYSALLKDSLARINDAFNNKRQSTDPNAFSTNIRFELAELDPNGQTLPYKGLRVIYSKDEYYDEGYPKTEKIVQFIMNGNFWSPKKYINVWVLPLYVPFAFFPSSENDSGELPKSPQGVVVGNLVTSTLAHELGHAFGLLHVFGSYCGYDDFCNDTWSYINDQNSYVRLGQVKKNCEGEYFQSNNFMDYPECAYNTFTLEQAQRMHKTMQEFPFFPLKVESTGGRKKIDKQIIFEGQKVIN